MSLNKLTQYFKRQVAPGEWPLLLASFLYFFFLLCGYFLIRSIREQMGVVAGVENFHWLFLGTLLVTLAIQPVYGRIVSKYTRRVFLPYIYGFFALVILVFWLCFHSFGISKELARSFFIFISVYNVFIVSLFWSFMADVYTKSQGKRLFGLIASGGSAGGIIGPLMGVMLVDIVGAINLIFVSFLCMLLVLCMLFIVRRHASDSQIDRSAPMGGSSIEGFKLIFESKLLQQIALMTVLATFLGSLLYTLQGLYVSQYIEAGNQQTKAFNQINLITNSLTLFFQLVLTPYLLQHVKIHKTLAILPTLLVFVFALIGMVPIIYVVLGGIIVQRSGAYGIMKPPTDWLFTGLDAKTKYKFKNFLDTVVYRTGDTLAQWIIKGITTITKNIHVLAAVGVILAILWVRNAWRVGKLADEHYKNKEQANKALSD